ncbi:MFS transporter [Coraliomargarita sp. W4R53]
MSSKKLPTRDLWAYASGEGATSITMNGLGNFGMLFYTQILGMRPELVGMALFLATFWDAITDPLMGTITDRTNSRYGRRHPYMLIGGVVLCLSFLALWLIPESFQGEKVLFGYLLFVNIALKTAFTVFVVPYTALGFEMCKAYDDRARLQGVRYGFNMFTNILFGGLAWMLFFPDSETADGTFIDGTKVGQNYSNMGLVLTGVTFFLLIFCVYSTYKYAEKGMVKEADTGKTGMASHVKAFIHDLKDVYSDKLAWFVFIFFGLAQFSMMVVSQVQMFTYIEYMEFTAIQKTFVHTGGMVGFAIGSLGLGSMVKRWDKKKTGIIAMAVSSFGGLGLFAVFTGGLLVPQASVSGFPVAVAVFGLLQCLWWMGCGVLVPLATAMISDLAELKKWQTGEVSEGRYAAGFSFFLKLASSLGLLVTGYILKTVGYISGAETQTADAINNLAITTFLAGPILMALSFFVLRLYPLTHEKMSLLREQYGVDENE